jgi:hypothetical protein
MEQNYGVSRRLQEDDCVGSSTGTLQIVDIGVSQSHACGVMSSVPVMRSDMEQQESSVVCNRDWAADVEMGGW